MTTVTLWLLITVGYQTGHLSVLERFTTAEECARVQAVIRSTFDRPGLRCIQATVVKS
jgi:hypothetical protein